MDIPDIKVTESVYDPAEDSYLFAKNLKVKKGEKVLDMGTGSGILAIIAARQGGNVTATDINPQALECARRNAQKNKVKIDFLESDLFKNIKGKFDLIIFNAPYVPTDPGELKDVECIAWAGGEHGRKVIIRFVKAAPKFLKPGGRILLMVSSLNDVLDDLRMAFETRIVAEKRLFLERLYVIELVPKDITSSGSNVFCP